MTVCGLVMIKPLEHLCNEVSAAAEMQVGRARPQRDDGFSAVKVSLQSC